jgi:hypothetical protein
MKFTNKTKVYIYTFVLFVFTFTFVSTLMKNYKSNDYDYLRLGISFILIVSSIINIIKLASIENNTNDKD